MAVHHCTKVPCPLCNPGASSGEDRATHERNPQAVSAVPVGIPSARQTRAANAVADLIREVGIYRLGGSDGCPCTNFEVQNVHVSVSCHKSGDHGLRVWTNHADYSDENYRRVDAALRVIAQEVLRQVDDYYDAHGEYAATFDIRYRSWEKDNRNCGSAK
jgi:hypothetical protein